MAAILKLRRGTSFTSLQESEFFYHNGLETVLIGDGSGSNTTYKTLVKLTESNSGSLNILGDISGSSISASGDITASSLNLKGDADIEGNIVLGGSIFLGDGGASDEIIVNASLSGSLIPDVDSAYDLGSVSKKYNHIFAVSASIENANFGNGMLSSSVTDFTDYSSSINTRLGGLDSTTASLDARLDVEESKSTTLETVTSSLDTRLDIEEAKSVTLETVTSSFDNRLDNLELDSASQDGRLDNLELESASQDNRLDVEEAKSTTLETVTSSLDTRLDNVESYTSSFATDTVTLTNKTINGSNNTLTVDISRDTNLAVSDTTEVNMILTDDTISAELIGGVVSGSSQINADTVTNFDSNVKTKLDDETVISGSSQVDYSSISGINNNIISASSDTSQVDMIINGGSISANLKGGVVSGSIQILGGSNILSSSNENFNGFSSSVDSRLDLEEAKSATLSPLTASYDNRLNNLQITSASHDGRLDNLELDTHTHANKATLDAINQGLSTSDNVTFADGDFTGDVQVTGNLTVLGSATEISSTELRIEDKLITVASGSTDSAAADGAGIEIDGAGKSLKWDHNTTSFVLNAKVSSSVGFKGEGGELTGIDTDQVTEASNLYYTDTRVKTKLDAESVISGSSQIDYSGLSGINNDIVSASTDTAQVDMIIDDGSISANLKGGVVSGSSQIDHDSTSNFVANEHINHTSVTLTAGDGLSGGGDISTNRTFTLNVDDSTLEINADAVRLKDDGITNSKINSSAQISHTKLNLSGSNLVSGSTQIDYSQLSGIDANIISASSDTSEVNMIINGGSISAELIGGVVSSSLQVSLYNDFLEKNGMNVFSGSSQIDHDSTTNFVANEHIDHSTITLGSGKGLNGGGTIDTNRSLSLDTGSTHFIEGIEKGLPSGVISGSGFESNHQGSITSSINNVSTNVDLGLNISDSPTFNTLTLSNVASGGSSDFDALFDVSGLLKKRTIGTAAFLNVSASIADDPNSIPTTKAVNDALVAAGAGDITAVNSTTTISPSTTGLVHTEEGTSDSGAYGNTGNIVIAIATGSSHFVNAVQGIAPSLPSGVVSGSSQINANTVTNFDTNVKAKLDEEEVFSGSLSSSDITEISNLTAVEGEQLENINSVTISNTQWGYLGGMDQDVKTTSDVTFASASLSNVVISGNLTVLGDAVELAVSELTIEDKTITVASGSADSAAADGAGIIIAGAGESITWNHGSSRFDLSDDIHVTGTIKSTDDIIAYASSDKELKNNIQPIQNSLEKINKISGNSFDWNEDKQDIYKGKDYGVIAQEIEEVLPELVITRENGYKAVKYDKLVSLLIEGIKDLSKQVEELKNK